MKVVAIVFILLGILFQVLLFVGCYAFTGYWWAGFIPETIMVGSVVLMMKQEEGFDYEGRNEVSDQEH